MLNWDQASSIASMRDERAWLEIDRAALAHNTQQVCQWLKPQSALMAVVKADGYGHGAVTVAQTVLAAGARGLGVATVPEGIELREAGISAPIVVLGAVNRPEQMRAIAHWQLQPTLCTPKQALVFAETLQNQVLPVHLKLDTGMSRLGTPWIEAVDFVQWVRRLPTLKIASLYSHLATADDPDLSGMIQQQQRFEQAIAQLRLLDIPIPALHLANSAATLACPTLHYDWVRVGLCLYGFYPAPHLKHCLDLRPVLSVKARITQVKTIAAGTGVSYGHQFVADQDLRLAVVGIGYADGVPRGLSNQLQGLLRGQPVRQLGAITMDQLMMDVTPVPDVHEGEVVTLLGQDGNHCLGAESWAACLGTITWEILCGFKQRLPRITVGQPFPLAALE
jgi:alanine racemase